VAPAAPRPADRPPTARDGLAAPADFAADLLNDANLADQEVVA